MGYTTYFTGMIKVEPPLSAKEVAYLNRFSESRRMHREKGPYHIGAGDFGQAREPDIISYNSPPPGQPGLWCHWVPTDEGDGIVWDEGEKFYSADEWMEYIIEHFLDQEPFAKEVDPDEFSFLQGHVLNGEIEAQGEEASDVWKLVVKDNVVTVKKGHIVYEEV
jgi:hypothetical protein